MLVLRKLVAWGQRFRTQESGQIAVIVALSIVGILGVATLGIDYAGALSRRSTLNAAADAAALAAVGTTGRSHSVADAQTIARNVFNANISQLNATTLDSVDIRVSDSAGVRSVEVRYEARYHAMIQVLGPETIAISGQAQAMGPSASFIDFYLLLDNTPSMGLGATTTDINRMVANTPDQCAFACHQMDKPGTDYYALARSLGVNMRIDVVRSATRSLMDTASAQRLRTDQFRMAIYTFGARAEVAGLSEIQPLTTDLVAAKSAASAIDLMTIPYQNYKGDTQTDFDTAFGLMNSRIATPGDGSVASAPKKVLFYVSDGLNDANKAACTGTYISAVDGVTNTPYDRCMEPLNPRLCDTIKARGISIAVLYTTYFPLPTNQFYIDTIQPFQSTIASKMSSCASDGLYFEVGPNQGITEAMNALFLKAVRTVSLTR